MDCKSNLRRTQSLRSVSSSCDQPSWTQAGLRDKKASVSQLVSRYQTTLDVSTSTKVASANNGEAKPKQVLTELTPSLLESTDTHLEFLTRRSDEGVRSRGKTSLSRSKSMGSLHNSTGSIEALKALFESKAATQNKVKSNFRAANSTSATKATHMMPVMQGEAEVVKKAAEEPKSQISVDTDVADVKTSAKEDRVSRKVVNHTRKERRKTIGGIDFEKRAASEADERRRSTADFRDSSFIHDKEKLCISVKAMSALYLSKVAPQETNHGVLKPEQDQSSEIGKRVKLTKMDKESQQRGDDLPSPTSSKHQAGPEDVSRAHSEQYIPFQLSKEELYQQRQRCELRRLLKHTHPELKLDEVVDEELAEVLSSESGVTAGETGYEGEVLTRRLIFENKASAYALKTHMTDGKVETANVSKTSAVFEGQEERPLHSESADGEDIPCYPSSHSNRELEEEVMRTHGQATRKIFNAPRPKPDSEFRGNISITGEEKGAIQKQKQEFKTSSKDKMHSENKSSSTDVTERHPHIQSGGQNPDQTFSEREEASTVENVFDKDPRILPGPEGFEEMIKTSPDLLKNNPFISTNIERENSFVHKSDSRVPANPSEAAEDCLITNVKDRTHLFESMPFDRIRHQNKDEVETMVENIKETLNSLYHVDAIHSGGSIIEVNETMRAKKAKFSLSESRPIIKYDEVAEGGAQNFLLQLMPRSNLKPQVTYLKEDSKGCTETTVVHVPLHQFTTSQDTHFKTANMVQLVEDMLNQDNSLRKGVIIQEDATNCPKVIVYSLYNYFDEEDVKSYIPPQVHAAENNEPETDRSGTSKAGNHGVRKGIIKSTISCLTETSQDQSCLGSIRPEPTIKGNVKLFKSCIEKGDLEYLKTLQAVEEQEQGSDKSVAGQDTELLLEKRGDEAEESVSEWAPVDIKRLKSMFSGDQKQTQTRQNFPKNHTTSPHGFTGQNMATGKTECLAECNKGVFSHGQEKRGFRHEVPQKVPQGSYTHLRTQDEDTVLQVNLVEAVDDNDENCNLQSALPSLQQTVQTKSSSPHDKQICGEEPKNPHKVDMFPERNDEATLTFNVTTKQISNTKPYGEDPEAFSKMEGVHKYSDFNTNTSEAASAQQLEEEVVFDGKLQAALESLERSNINVTRGDFRAAMIYRNSFKPVKERSQNVDVASVHMSTVEGLCPVTEAKSPEERAVTNVECQTLFKPAVSDRNKTPVGPKPAIPPKPEHLKMKQTDNQSATAKDPKAAQINAARHEQKTQLNQDTIPQPPAVKSASYEVGNKAEPSKTHSAAGYKDEDLSQDSQVKTQIQGLSMTLEGDSTDKNNLNQPEAKNTEQEVTKQKDFPVKENVIKKDDSLAEFHEAGQKCGGSKNAFAVKTAPAKPKRLKIAQPDIVTQVDPKPQQTVTAPSCSNTNTCAQSADSKKEDTEKESKVEMREKKGRTETEDERRQRLSVHMDEIVRGNVTAAMEIFDNLRKQEELQSILSRVEEIEQDTNEVDVTSLSKVYENIPNWVVSEDKKREKKVKVLLSDNSESKSSMAHVFGDLERASEEIMNLKEQTLARLMDIEEAIRKALYSVSTLKSESDIAGLSCLFKESLGAVQESPLSANISKISIGSSRTKAQQAQKSSASPENVAQSAGQSAAAEAVCAKQRESPQSSPAFISIQSAARKPDQTQSTVCPTCQQSPSTGEIFRTTKTLTCNSPAQNRKGGQKQSTYSSLGAKQELSVLEVQTHSVNGTKTLKENYETTDTFGNRFYSSKTSTVVTSHPETMTSSSDQTLVCPTHQVTAYPDVRLQISQKP